MIDGEKDNDGVIMWNLQEVGFVIGSPPPLLRPLISTHEAFRG